MKKILVSLLALGVLLISGCASNTPGTSAAPVQTQPGPAATQTANAVPVAAASAALPQAKPSSSGTDAAANPFFFKSGTEVVNYKMAYSFSDANEGEATLRIKKIDKLAKGTVYELKLDAVPGIPDDRLSLGYFYVQQDKIYKTDPTQEYLNILKTQELPCHCFIVCQEEELTDPFASEPGFHQYITVNGGRREYHSYNDDTETGYYESFTWEKGKGLVAYQSGYGAERDSIDLQLTGNR